VAAQVVNDPAELRAALAERSPEPRLIDVMVREGI
jgi:hypothetical protein